jgi:hypothetical protein
VLRAAIEAQGGIVVDTISYEGSGCDPIWIGRAAKIAKSKGATLLAETTDRFVRSPYYHSKRFPDARARETELQELVYWADGVPMMTLLHPDASFSDVRSAQTKRGQQEKGERGGRPQRTPRRKTKQIRNAVLRKAIELWLEGESFRSIGNHVGIPHRTIGDWMKRDDAVRIMASLAETLG